MTQAGGDIATEAGTEGNAASARASQDHPPGRVPAGYMLMLPPGWHRIPVQRGARAAVKKIVEDAFARRSPAVSPDQLVPLRLDLERRLSAMISQARERGGVDLYLPLEPRRGVPIAASFVVSQFAIGGGPDQPADADAVLAHLASLDASATVTTVDEAMAIRTERVADADPAQGVDERSRRVDYVVGMPGDPARWLAVAFSTLGGGDPDDKLALALAQLFDAMMSTFRWDWR
jgi:hypothetical protein